MQAFLQGLKLLLTLSPLPPPGIIFKDDAFNIINRLSAQNIMPWKLMSMWKQILLNISRISVGRVQLSRFSPPLIIFTNDFPLHIHHVYLERRSIKDRSSIVSLAEDNEVPVALFFSISRSKSVIFISGFCLCF